ncbi:uncharacterized protein At4g06598 [Andrographis paniculata]|uniref:uncharacterized protein At4g06598 n=1 Tax=Andrographis paniculata TaxID=175694 RepID=UPI0021E8B7B1|nr:uncharacterized protein At4g06598 [Andrographis paniculata]
MANSKGPSNVRSMLYTGKSSLLPPKSPFPSISPTYTEFIPSSAIGPKAHTAGMPRDGNSHQRTSSESFLMVEQPSWLDELLEEPETPMRRGHRRSSSDSFAYLDSSANVGNMGMNYSAQDDNNNKQKNITPALSPWHSPDFDIYRGVWKGSFPMDQNTLLGKTKSKPWEPLVAPARGLPLSRGNSVEEKPTGKKDMFESGHQDPKGLSEKKDTSHAKSSETDSKRAKQQFAQRSRVRKLQYIAELERNVQSLQAEGSEVSAEVEFLNQQNLILSLENKALKQRLESLAQEQLIKYLEHEVLEREVGRLRTLYQQQQQPSPQQPASTSLRRANSRDLDQHFANLSLKTKEAGAGRDSLPDQLHM